jgi:multidrug resistance efflux pump
MTSTQPAPPLKLRDEAFADRAERGENDEPLRVDRPRAWIALCALAVLALALLVFGFAGKLPQKLAAPAVIERTGERATVQSIAQGQVRGVAVAVGDEVAAGAPILDLYDAEGQRTTVRASFAGSITQMFVAPGNVVLVGSDLFAMHAAAAGGLVAYAFLDAADVGSVAPGMRVDVLPLSTQQFGAIRGRLLSIESSPSAPAAVGRLLRDGTLADQFTRGADPFVARIALEPDPATASGVRWSKGDGPPFALTSDTPATAEIHQGTRRPVDLVLGT